MHHLIVFEMTKIKDNSSKKE